MHETRTQDRQARQVPGGPPRTRPEPDRERPTPSAPFAHLIGRSRFTVLLAVAAVTLVAISLFVIGTVLSVVTVMSAVLKLWHAGPGLLAGEFNATELTVQFLEIVSVMLKAVVFYLVGVGFYSLFVAPLNLTAALGIETFNDLEAKVASVVVVILAITFLEHFILWERPTDVLQFGIALALVVVSLVFFQVQSHRAKEEWLKQNPHTQIEAKRELFHEDHEKRVIHSEEQAQQEVNGRKDRGPASDRS